VFCGELKRPLTELRPSLLREHLEAAGIDRPELFERSASRQPIRVHDLRATFVTLSLAAGKTETWVQDRTGHTTNAMLQRYRRAARTVREVALGPLLPLDEALPECRRSNGTVDQDPWDEQSAITAAWERLSAFVNRRSPVQVRKVAPTIPAPCEGAPDVRGSGRGSIVDHALRAANAIRTGDADVAVRVDELLSAVADLTVDLDALRLEVSLGGPMKYRRAVDLIERLLGELERHHVADNDCNEESAG